MFYFLYTIIYSQSKVAIMRKLINRRFFYILRHFLVLKFFLFHRKTFEINYLQNKIVYNLCVHTSKSKTFTDTFRVHEQSD